MKKKRKIKELAKIFFAFHDVHRLTLKTSIFDVLEMFRKLKYGVCNGGKEGQLCCEKKISV